MIRLARSGASGCVGNRLSVLFAVLIAANAATWLWAALSFRTFPLLLGTCLLAYTFGLRHAVDADHIAAIDNVTRKLMQEGKRPIGVGLYFSLGHSTIVFALSMAIACTSFALRSRFDSLAAIGGLIGTMVSALFLLGIALINLLVMISIYRTFRIVRQGGELVESDLNVLLNRRGLLGRLFGRLFRLIDESWHMYFLGFLFGLGFDTATEVGVLGISAIEASKGLPIWSILLFPALFTAGMALVDTADGVLMLRAYNWAFLKPLRKLYYNMAITALSVAVAVLISGVEILGLLGDQLKLQGAGWDLIGALNDHFGELGLCIIALFVACWLGSMALHRWNRRDELEIRIDPIA